MGKEIKPKSGFLTDLVRFSAVLVPMVALSKGYIERATIGTKTALNRTKSVKKPHSTQKKERKSSGEQFLL